MSHNNDMRYLILSLALVPSVLELSSEIKDLGPAGYGRGNVNPPTVAEMAEIKCLATMVYGEARGEQETGQIAVAYSAVNRATGNKSLCDVVLAPKQYSIFNNNPALRAAAQSLHLDPMQKNPIDKGSWKKAQHVADIVFRRKVSDPTDGSTHYLAPAVMRIKGYVYPKWSKQYTLTTVIDNHKFYKPYYPKKGKND
jgi:spore germination cell wall hydrolase CwlJ-like protein